MTEKQKRFADEYLKDCNATRAYKAAYPNVKSNSAARVNSSKLLTNANIQNYIDKQLEALHDERTADAGEVMEYLTSVLRGESSSEVVAVEFVGNGISRAKKIQKAPDEKERLKAAELLGRRYRMFTDKVDVEGAVPVIITGENELEN